MSEVESYELCEALCVTSQDGCEVRRKSPPVACQKASSAARSDFRSERLVIKTWVQRDVTSEKRVLCGDSGGASCFQCDDDAVEANGFILFQIRFRFLIRVVFNSVREGAK